MRGPSSILVGTGEVFVLNSLPAQNARSLTKSADLLGVVVVTLSLWCCIRMLLLSLEHVCFVLMDWEKL